MGVISEVPIPEVTGMVWVPGGSFQMGSESGESNEKPVHLVTLSPFYMGKYEVTQARYEEVMGSNPSDFTSGVAAGETQENRPVEDVSWYDALVFCNTLSMSEGLTPAYSIDGSGMGVRGARWKRIARELRVFGKRQRGRGSVD